MRRQGCLGIAGIRHARRVPRSRPFQGDENLPWEAKCFWLKYSNGFHHPRSVFVGYDKDGGNLYVGRLVDGGDLLPCKVVPNHRCAYAASRNQEINTLQYEVLVIGSGVVEWQKASDGDVPARALPVGYTKDGEVSYSVRVQIDGTTTPGKLVPSEGKCCISYDCKEFTFQEYEVLTVQ
ncbi:uncharacterized protein [Anabrus simplex]|uniref:uncharacterized protein isoform X2 n=1 Tax=Anabrus simplex TaxID=316456 RepID=UPI0035A37B54